MMRAEPSTNRAEPPTRMAESSDGNVNASRLRAEAAGAKIETGQAKNCDQPAPTALRKLRRLSRLG
jgi:hypothetical protein